MSVWLSGNALVSINIITLRRVRIVPGWKTVLGHVKHLDAEPDTQVGLARAIPQQVGAMSTQQKHDILAHIYGLAVLAGVRQPYTSRHCKTTDMG